VAGNRTDAVVVLVHGAWHGAWCWTPVIEQLDLQGVAARAVDLPSVRAHDATLHDDADEVRRLLDTVDAPVVLVGHSYAGAVITDAGAHEAVRDLIYISAFVLDDGETVQENNLRGGEGGSVLDEAVRLDGDVLTIDPSLAVAAFYHDCDPETARSATNSLRPQSLASFGGSPRAIAWHDKPAVYAVCTDDRAVHPDLQRSNARRVSTAVEWPTSHSPFVSRPGLVAELIVRRARSAV
jgi:pimeloyl-ACP methyl ester carboxylesterase